MMLEMIQKRAQELKQEMIDVRRDFHMHPEAGFEEVRTGSIVAKALQELGLEVQTGVAKTGVVGLLRGARPGKTIALRADMDALKMEEDNPDLPYASCNPGVMHACGHDGHVSMLMAAAKILTEMKEHLHGNVKFIFQPAEEGVDGGGARVMVQEGVLENPAVDAIVGLHIWASMPTGNIALRKGPMMASSDSFNAKIIGKGGHGASPQDCIDPILVASHVITALQSIVSREIRPVDSAVITIGTFHAGTANNIIAQKAELGATVRSLDPEIRKMLPRRVEGIIKGVTEAMRASYELEYRLGYPIVMNDDATTELLHAVSASVLGEKNIVYPPHPVMGSEDFAYYLEKVPGSFAFLGAGNPEKKTGQAHHPKYNFDEDVLPLGCEILVQSAYRYLSQKD
jgi:amidohydrolase